MRKFIKFFRSIADVCESLVDAELGSFLSASKAYNAVFCIYAG
jgi:hypothetical protein